MDFVPLQLLSWVLNLEQTLGVILESALPSEERLVLVRIYEA